MSHASAVEALLFAALEKATDAERNAFLDSACAGDAELRRQVERLLTAEARAGDFLQKPVLEQWAAPQPSHESNRTTDHVAAAGSTDQSHSAADAPGGGLPALPGYRVLREIARGGMGRVLAARDLTLDRDIALKVLLPGANPARFVRESKITARLPHPGIPPVHALGTLADGSPFLAMKLIAGQTLAVEIKTADRPRLLQVFTQVCQAVGFAHSKGVVHRDLKPANVMVGAFGEVQVMDWGLAKDVTSPDRRDEPGSSAASAVPIADTDPAQTTDHKAAGESTDDQTQAGTILGTPAYMAPEQARGEACAARSDVFALGGILCAILTGQAPYSGKSAVEMIRRAAAADLAEAYVRLDGCGADAELVTLCRRCLSANPADRPADGQAVADGMTAYLNGAQERLQTAQRERAVAVAREAEQRKRRKVQLALAAVVMALLLGGGAFAWWRNAQLQAGHDRDTRTDEAVAVHLDQAKEALRVEDAARVEVALEAAKKRSAEGGAEKHAERLARLKTDLNLLRDLQPIDQYAGVSPRMRVEEAAPRTRQALARFFGADPDVVSVDEAAARLSASVVGERVLWTLDRLLWQEKTVGVHALLRQLDDDRYRNDVRDAVLAADRKRLRELVGQKPALEQSAGFAAFLGEIGELVDVPVQRRRQLLQVAVSRQPNHLDLLIVMGDTYSRRDPRDADARLRWNQAAVAAAPGNHWAYLTLGITLCDQKRDYDGAIACFEKAIAINPRDALAHSNKGIALDQKGQRDDAIACYRTAVELAPEFGSAHRSLGDALRRKGQLDEAIEHCRKAVELEPSGFRANTSLAVALSDKGKVAEAIKHFRKATELEPKNGKAHANLATALGLMRQMDEAITHLRKAIEHEPNNADFHVRLGTALSENGKGTEAIRFLRKATELEPSNARNHYELGLVLAENDQSDRAIDCYRKAIELDPMFALAHYHLGEALEEADQLDLAIDCYRKAVECDPKYAEAYSSLGSALAAKGQLGEAIKCFRKIVELKPTDSEAHFNLGNALADKGEVNETIECWKKASELAPNNPLPYSLMGDLLSSKGRPEEAIACYRKVVELVPRDAGTHQKLTVLLKARGDLDGAIVSGRKVVELRPRSAVAHTNLGLALRAKGDRDGAIDVFRKAAELAPKDATTLAHLGLALKDKGDLDGAIDSTRKAVELAPKNAWAHDTLGYVLMVKGDLDEAIDHFRKAISLDPKYRMAFTNLARAERMAPVQGKLPALLKGEYQPQTNDERLALADLCNLRRLYRASAGLYADAFAADPRLADDLKAAHRYYAASCAALAAAGQGEDAAGLDGKEKARLRQQSLDWLRADLVLRTRQLESGLPADRADVRQKMTHWQNDRDLAGVRDTDARAKLPAEERTAWERLWGDVAALLKKAETPAP